MKELVRFSPLALQQKSTQALKTIEIKVPKNMRLPDDNQWKNKVLVKSSSSDNLWVVSQNKSTGIMGCSCPGWKRARNGKRHCKHLAALQLPSGPINLKVIDI